MRSAIKPRYARTWPEKPTDSFREGAGGQLPLQFVAAADAVVTSSERTDLLVLKFNASAAREGHNLATGATTRIAASKKLAFSAAKVVKDRLVG
jgi:hypothetical protein